MKIKNVFFIPMACLSLAAGAYDQPDVKYFIEVARGNGIAECPVLTGSLGESLEARLGNGMRVAARSTPLDAQGRSRIDLKVYSATGALAHEKTYVARLSQQKPSFQFGGVTVLVQSESLLKTNKDHPSGRDFDPRVKGGYLPDAARGEGGCKPLLRS